MRRPQSALKPPPVKPETWTALMQATSEFCAMQPWRHMWDCDMLGIEDEATGNVRLACVLGRNRECFGLVVYRGVEGVRSVLQMAAEEPDIRGLDPMFMQDCARFYLNSSTEIDPGDRAHLKTHGYRPHARKGQVYPSFRAHSPGYYPWHFTQAEAETFLADMRRVMAFAPLLREQPSLSDHRPPGTYAFFPRGAWEPGRVLKPEDLRWLPVKVPPTPEPVPLPLSGTLAPQLVKLPQDSKLAWETDAFFSDFTISDRERPYFGKLGIVTDAQTGMVLGFALHGCDETIWETGRNALTEAMQKTGKRPGAIHCSNPYLLESLKGVAETCGIKLKFAPALPGLEEARIALEGALRSGMI